ncbi:hypothetical protein [Robertmurraya siralis]|uniref:hypothetical protein n=1 Tax=Robertmurraya siralis TaxID=77777 RepID=UPI001B87E800|nr:hypothetical protein [Robertmurraya siralis]
MATEQTNTRAKFSKKQILSSANFKERRDLLTVLLNDDKKYSIKEVEQEIDKFMKKKVK